MIQGGKLPVSKPPLTTMQAGVDVGVGVGVGEVVAVGEGDAVGVGEGVPPISGTKLTKISCCDWLLMMVRPSVQPPMAVPLTVLW